MKSVRRLLKFAKPYWRWLAIAPPLMIVEVVMDLIQPTLVSRIVDVGIQGRDLGYVIRVGALMVGLAMVGAISAIFNGVFAAKASQGVGADLRDALFRKVQFFSFDNLDQVETGQLITRLTNDVAQVQMALHQTVRILVRAPLLLIGSLVMFILTVPQLTLVPTLLAVLVLAGLILIINRAYPLYSLVQKALDRINVILQENLSGVRVVKAFVRANHEVARFRAWNATLKDRTVRVARVTALTMPLVTVIVNLGIVAIMWFGGIQFTLGTLTTGEIIAATNYLVRTLTGLQMVAMIVLQTARAEASADRITEVLDTESTVQSSTEAIRDFKPRGRVTFEHVSFGYRDGAGKASTGNNGGPPSDGIVLNDISFTAEPGQTVAILGSTGSGKSTLVNLIPRFYDVSEGRIAIDGVDVRDVDAQTLRRNIGIALQETVLFSGTIRDNIRYGRPDATDDEVVAAAKAAQAHDFILSFPHGYDTVLGQRGVNLSGGQKQRLAIARALLLQPAILILDDSTSAVDVETEARIQDALKTLMKDRTSFVIAQRVSTVLTANKILVLDEGHIAAEGNHEELLANSAIYRDIYDSQLGNGNGKEAYD
ncbi:MAG: ABC transporter ATP-binding protein [Anaerolineae bacterium]|nr:ABC transporter ATP-binding protein [Anaerolineae bacterium]